jgi:hypothetical protein
MWYHVRVLWSALGELRCDSDLGKHHLLRRGAAQFAQRHSQREAHRRRAVGQSKWLTYIHTYIHTYKPLIVLVSGASESYYERHSPSLGRYPLHTPDVRPGVSSPLLLVTHTYIHTN